MQKIIVILFIVSLVFTPNFSSFTQATELTPEEVERVESLIASMTLEEKVGQMFMVNIYGTELAERGTAFITDYHPGAVAIFAYNTDFEPPSQVATFLNQIQQVASTTGAGVPLFIATDHEGGTVQRIVNEMTWFPDPSYLGAASDPEPIARMGAAVGRELHALGVNMNLAPIADLQTRGDALNQYRVMHRRTFGDDPDRVGWQVAAYTDGLAEQGVVGVIKHYPGHGGAADSHAGLPNVETDAETARETALKVFQVAVENGVPAIMVGHLYYSAIEPEPDLPATLSPTMIGILRDEFGFDGVVMTDAMDMSAVANNFYVPDAALMAVQAGVDMFVAGPYMTWDMQRDSMQRLTDAVNSGELSLDRIDQSVRRILTVKAAYGLLDWTATDTTTVNEHIDLDATQQALFETYMDIATVVHDDQNLLPLSADDNVAIIHPTVLEQIPQTCDDFSSNITFFNYTRFEPARWEYGAAAKVGREHDKIVIFIEDAILNPTLRDLVLTLPPEKTIIVSLGLPYDLEFFPEYSTFMAMYHSIIPARYAACNVLFGQHPARGRLPVAVGDFPTGSGIDVE